MANTSIPDSPTRNEQSNSDLTPAVLRRIERKQRTVRPVTPETAGKRVNSGAAGQLALSSLATLALVGVGLAAVELARIALAYEALAGWFEQGGNNSTLLPFAAVLTLGLAALDGGLLLRLFIPSTAGRNDSWATWAAVGAWLVATTANTWLVMYALTAVVDATAQLAGYAPAAVAVVLLVLRLLLVGALAADGRAVIRGGD